MSELERALEVLHPEDRPIELRPIMPDGRWWTGLYDDRSKFVAAVKSLNEIEAKAIYWSINPISPALAGRVTNRVGPAKKGMCVANKDIERIRWLFLDIDPKPSRKAAYTLAASVKAHLEAKGWAEPVFVDSGNGCYLYYAVDLAPDQKGLIKKVVGSLKARFDLPEAIIDQKCVNPGRIARVPGSYNRKDSPRLARILPSAEEVAA
jgi:hypothetical protein